MSLDLPTAALPQDEAADTSHLTGRQKAAIVVRLLLSEGAVPALARLPESLQTELVLQMAQMKAVDQSVVRSVADEFADLIDRIGLSFPAGLEGALGLLDGVISPSASSRVRKLTSSNFRGDPWEKVGAVEIDRLVPVMEAEAVEIAAVILSKLKVSKAAELLGRLSGDRARRITYAVSMTGGIAPDAVRRIGISLAEQLETRPARAFADGPVARVGAILNHSPASIRDDVLDGLDKEDAGFAEQVRKAIFTFANIRDRVAPGDIPRIQRDLDQSDLVTAIAFAEGEDLKSVDHILSNISQRLADSLREEAGEKGKVPVKDGEAAMMRIVGVIRALESAGELHLVSEED